MVRATPSSGRDGSEAKREPVKRDDGHPAARPSQFRRSDWKTILKRVREAIQQDNLALIAAGVAFWAMLALFPAIAAVIGLYGLIADPATIQSHLETLREILPDAAFGIIADQVNSLVQQDRSLGVASLLAIVISLWSARLGVKALVTGLNVVYDRADNRGFLQQILVTLALTALLIGVVLVAFAAVIVVPAIIAFLPLGSLGERIADLARWPIALVAVAIGLTVLYRYGPNRARPRVRWVTWGAAVATLLWLVGSLLFSLYVANFANYNETYGSLGAIVGLLMWFYLSAFAMLLGAELNAEMERHTTCQTASRRKRHGLTRDT